tara:strand:+ start:174 stop:791 length:618 start_codon:yes stop_codon:yes gene_type:complete
MATKTLSRFKSQLAGGGARPNLFDIELTTVPFATGWNAEKFEFMAKATALPAQNIAAIDVPFRGRTFKVAGDRTIDNWTVTVINDEDFGIRNAFEDWTQGIAKLENNMGATNPESYMVDAKVFQLGRGGEKESKSNSGTDRSVLKVYQFVSIFPVTVGDIALSYESGDTIEEFDVEFAVQSIRLLPAKREQATSSDVGAAALAGG